MVSLSARACADLPALVLQALDLLEPGHWVQQLHPHGPEHGPAVKEEEVPAGPRVPHRVLDEGRDGVALELGEGPEREVALLVLDAHVAHRVVQLEGQREEVAVVARVAHHERAVGLQQQQALGGVAADRAPVPTALE